MQNRRREELKLQLELYLEENYVGERLKPYGTRVPDPRAIGFHSEMPRHETGTARYDAKEDDGACCSISAEPFPQSSFETGPGLKEDSGENDYAFDDIFKIFSRSEDVDAIGAAGDAPAGAVPAPTPGPTPAAAPCCAPEPVPGKIPDAPSKDEARYSLAPVQGKYSRTHTIRDYLIDRADNETFTEYMLRIIKERDLKESEVYNRVFMDRRHFNRIRNDPEYQPSKRTAMLLAIALHLSLSETQEFIGKAGYVISHSSKTDLIVEFFIVKGNYNILEINEMLHEFNMPLLMKCE